MDQIPHSELGAYINAIKTDENTSEGLRQARLALKMAEKYGDKILASRAHNRLCLLMAQEGTREEEEFHAKEGLRLSIESGNNIGVVVNMQGLANFYLFGGDMSRAFALRKEALQFARDHEVTSQLPNVLHNMGADYGWLGEYEKALECFTEGLRFAIEYDDRPQIGFGHESLATSYLNEDHFDLAIDHVLQAMKYYKRPSFVYARATLLLATIYRKAGRYAEAEQTAREVVEYHRGEDKRGGTLSQSLTLIGICLLKQDDPTSAREFLTEAVQIGERSELYEAKFDAYDGLADLELAEHNLLAAGEWIAKAESIAIGRDKAEIGRRRLVQLKGLRDFEAALQCLEDINKMEAADTEDRYQNRIAALQVEHDLTKKEAEATLLREKAEHLERELAFKASTLAEQTDLLATFREDLRHILRKIEAKDPAINELYAKLKELPEAVNWREFEEQFQKVHPEFRSNLSKKYPTLTDVELQIAALLRLKLKSPDIGKLLSLSERTVQNHRYRIRKKLDLKTEDDIAKYLQAF